jgi:hypothetical protein
MGLAGGLLVYYGAKMVGLTNTMLPLIKHENSEDQDLVNTNTTRQLEGRDDLTLKD